MSKANRICYTDNTPYYYCPSCPSERKKESFYNMFCCERCSKIFNLLTDETFKHITTEQCKQELLKLNVSPEEKFKEGIKLHIQRVLEYNPPIEDKIIEIKDNFEKEDKVEPKEEVIKIKNVPKKRTNKNSEVD